MDLHRNDGAVFQVLTGRVEVELFKVEGLVVVGDQEGAALAGDLDRGPQVLKDSPGREVGDVDVEFRARNFCHIAGDIDGRLVGTVGASSIGRRVEGKPVRRALFQNISQCSSVWKFGQKNAHVQVCPRSRMC